MIERRSAVVPIEAGSGSGDPVVLAGIGVPFSTVTDLGTNLEQFDPGAFDRQIADGWGLDGVVGQYMHDRVVLANTRSGTLQLAKMPSGLRVSMSLASSARFIAESVGRGDLGGLSVGFSVIEDDWTRVPEGPLRTIQRAHLWEVSVCAQPAYRTATVAVASGPNLGRSFPPSAPAHVRSLADARARLDAKEARVTWGRMMARRERAVEWDVQSGRRR